MPLQGNAQIAPPNCAALELAADRLSPLSAASKGQANCTQFSSDFSQVLQSVKDRRASEVENEKREVESDPQLVYLLLTAQPILASAMQNTVQSTPVSHDAASPGASPAVGNTASRAMICAAPSLAPESPSSIESHLAAFASLHSETPSFAGQINAATNSTAEGNAADRRSAIDFSAPAAAGETPANSTIPMPSAPSFDHSEAVFQPSFGNPSTILRQSFDKLRMPQDASGHLGMPVSSFDHPDVVLRQSFDNPSTSSGCLRTPVLIPLQPAAAQHTVPSSPCVLSVFDHIPQRRSLSSRASA